MSNAYGAASCARAPETAANATANAAREFLIIGFRMRHGPDPLPRPRAALAYSLASRIFALVSLRVFAQSMEEQ